MVHATSKSSSSADPIATGRRVTAVTSRRSFSGTPASGTASGIAPDRLSGCSARFAYEPDNAFSRMLCGNVSAEGRTHEIAATRTVAVARALQSIRCPTRVDGDDPGLSTPNGREPR
jgi:hypothetical protein